MGLFPSERFELRGKGPGPQVWRALQSMVEPPRRRRSSRPFEGVVHGRSFRIRPASSYRSTFAPILVGDLASDVPAVLRVRIRPGLWTRLFMAAWLTLTSLTGGLVLALQLRTGGLHLSALLAPLLSIAGYAVLVAGYRSQACRAKVLLSALSEQRHRPAMPARTGTRA
jgi:hypothetical protein